MTQSSPSPEEVETYCLEWMDNGNDQTKAWKVTFPKSKASDKSVWENASKFHENPKVLSRIRELRTIAAEKADEVYGITAESLIRDLAEIKQRALEAEQFGPSVSATMGQSKICGFDVQKIEVEVSGEISITDRIMKAKSRAREVESGNS